MRAVSILLTTSLVALLWVVGAAHAAVQVSGAWARATMPGQKVAGVYLQIESDVKARLVGVRCTAAKSAEVHEMSHVDGVMKMRKLEFLELPAGRPVALKPGGLHIMLLDIRQPLQPGQHVALVLIVEAGGERIEVPVDAEVRSLADEEHTRH